MKNFKISSYLGSHRIPPFREEEIYNKKSFLQSIIPGEHPKKLKEKNEGNATFTFLVHPRNAFDALECIKINGTGLGKMANIFPKELEQELKNNFLYKSLAKVPPFIIKKSDITVKGSNVRGNLVAVLLYGEQMLSNSWAPFAKKRIIEAISLAQKSGSGLVGLGAHTSPATLGGLTLRNNNGAIDTSCISDIGITNGNALTAGLSVEAVKNSAKILDLEPEEAVVGIIGASGSVGTATSRLLIEEGFKPILNGRSLKKLEMKFNDLKGRAVFSDNLNDMRKCDIIVVMTSAATSTLKPEHISPGTIIIEDTQPRNIHKREAKLIQQNGSIVIDGGYAHIPGYKCGFNLSLPPETAFACLAETLILAWEGRKSDYTLGDPQVERVKEILSLAKKHNVTVAEPTWSSKPIKEDLFTIVKHRNQQKR